MEGHRPRIVVLGAGNVATHLATALSAHCRVEQIWSRTYESATALASRIEGCHATTDYEEIDRSADFHIIAVPDHAVADVTRNLGRVDGIVAHTSGTTPLSVLTDNFDSNCKAGVFYPLQTFSRNRRIDLNNVPFLVEGNTPDVCERLWQLAALLSARIHKADSATRANIHLAAVFACNFANYLWLIADRHLRATTDFDLSLLHPLIEETIAKAEINGPETSQTGPAVRNDTETIDRQHASLPPDLAEVYKLLTERIISTFQQNRL